MIKAASEISGIKTNSSLTGIGAWVTIWKRKLGPYIIPYTTLNSKWIQGKNVNNKT